MKKTQPTLSEFIDGERRRRMMGVNEFARFVGVGHSQISKYLKGRKKQPVPGITFLRRLSSATGVPLSDILAIAFPEIREELKIDPAANMISRRIMQFENSTRDILIGIIESFEKGSNDN